MAGFDEAENQRRLLRRMLPPGGLAGLSENVAPHRGILGAEKILAGAGSPIATFSAPGTFSTGTNRKYFRNGATAAFVVAWRESGASDCIFELNKNGAAAFATITISGSTLTELVTVTQTSFDPADADYLEFEITTANGDNLTCEVWGV